MGDVIRLVSENVGDNFKIAANHILEQAMEKLDTVVVIGVDKDGELYVAGSDGVNYSLWLVEKAKKEILV